MIIRITAVRKTSYPDLMAKYENPIEHSCDVLEGQEWISVDGQCPEGMCPSAWGSMREFVEALARGEGNFFDGWMKNPMSAMISCNDGFRPVSFYIETKENPALAGVKELIGTMADTLPITFISSVDEEGYPCTKAMLSPRVREGIKTFYFTTNTFSLRVSHYKANPKASIYFCDAEGFKGIMLRGTMEVLTDAASKEMIWRDGDEEYYPGGVTDPNYCVLRFTATDGRFYSDFYPRSFVIE